MGIKKIEENIVIEFEIILKEILFSNIPLEKL
jgi:hypothetical protein